MIQQLEDYLVSLDQLLGKIRRAPTFIARSNLRQDIGTFGKAWFPLSTQLRAATSLPEERINSLDQSIEKLVELTMGSNRKTTYVNLLSDLKKTLQKDALVPLIRTGKSTPVIWEGVAAKILSKASSIEEKKFYEEAFSCAKNNCYKAATVMVACGVVDRLRKFVLGRGLHVFNATSKHLKSITTGFYKRFNKEFNLTLDNELQEVFEKDLVIVISGIVTLDLNQTGGILQLLETRNSCAHPSAYVMDELAFAHFLNEANKLVLENPLLS